MDDGGGEYHKWLILQKSQSCFWAMRTVGSPRFCRESFPPFIPTYLTTPRLPHIEAPSLGQAHHSLYVLKLILYSRISKGTDGHSGATPISLLRDNDQPFVFDIKFFDRPYRFEFFDTASPENWSLLQPNVIVLCYDISSRLSLINVQRLVGSPLPYVFIWS